MKNTLIILVILTFSCSTDKIDLVGDWKATQLVVNNTDSIEVPFFQPTYFKSESVVIYYKRKVFDSLNNVIYIPYNSSWERIR